MFKIKIAIHDSDVVISTLSVFANSNKLLSIGIMICRKTIKGVLCWTWNLLCYDKVFNSMLYWPIKTWNKFSKILLHHTNYLYSTMDKLIIWCTKTQVASINSMILCSFSPTCKKDITVPNTKKSPNVNCDHVEDSWKTHICFTHTLSKYYYNQIQPFFVIWWAMIASVLGLLCNMYLKNILQEMNGCM